MAKFDWIRQQPDVDYGRIRDDRYGKGYNTITREQLEREKKCFEDGMYQKFYLQVFKGKRGYINDNDSGHYLHKDGGESIQVDADEMYRSPVEGGKTFVEDIPSDQMQDIQQYYHNQQEEQRFGRGGLAGLT